LLLVFSEYGFIEFLIFDDLLNFVNKLKFNFSSHLCNISKLKKDYANRADLQNLFYLNEKFSFLEKFEFNKLVFYKNYEKENDNKLLDNYFLLIFFNFGILIFEIITAKEGYYSSEDMKIVFYQQITFQNIINDDYEIISTYKASNMLKMFYQKHEHNYNKDIFLENMNFFRNEKYDYLEEEIYGLNTEIQENKQKFDKNELKAFVIFISEKSIKKNYLEIIKEKMILKNYLFTKLFSDSKKLESNQGLNIREKESQFIIIKFNLNNKKFYV